MAGPERKRTAPFPVRLTPAERKTLEQKAGGIPLGTFIRAAALGMPFTSRQKRPVGDSAALGQILGLLGQSKLANNLNQLAKAANLGALPVTVETENDLRQACREVAVMRDLLMVALGMRQETFPDDAIRQAFREAAQ